MHLPIVLKMLLGVGGTGLKRFFNFKMMMSLFVYLTTGGGPCLQGWVQFSCASRRKQNLRPTNTPPLFYLLIALPVYNHFFGSWKLSVCGNYILQHKFTFFILQS
jgi:hypothetical protein